MPRKKHTPVGTASSRFKIHDELTAPARSADLLQTIGAKASQLPNYLGVLATSPALLRAYLRSSSELRHGQLDIFTRERISLAVAEHYGAASLLATHTRTANLAGLAADEIMLARRWRSQEAAQATLLSYLYDLLTHRGSSSEHLLETVREFGWSDEQIIEAFGWVALESMVAMVSAAADLPVDGSHEQTRLAIAA